MQADGDTVKKVVSNELYISPTLDRTVKTSRGSLSRKTSAASRARVNKAFTRTDTVKAKQRRDRYV